MKEKVVEVISYNSGCWYTSAGQRIAAARMDDGEIYFLDIDRQVGGKLNRKMNWAMNREQVHHQYLADAFEDLWPSHEMWGYLAQHAMQVKPLGAK